MHSCIITMVSRAIFLTRLLTKIWHKETWSAAEEPTKKTDLSSLEAREARADETISEQGAGGDGGESLPYRQDPTAVKKGSLELTMEKTLDSTEQHKKVKFQEILERVRRLRPTGQQKGGVIARTHVAVGKTQSLSGKRPEGNRRSREKHARE